MKLQNRHAGYALFKEGWLQKDIASYLGVTEKTVHSWKVKDDWVKKKTEANMAMTTAHDTVLTLINYNLRVLKLQTEANQKAFEQSGELADLKLLSKGDIDALSKLFASIKGPQKKWSDFVHVLRDFVEHMEEVAPLKAKDLFKFVEDYLNKKRTELNE